MFLMILFFIGCNASNGVPQSASTKKWAMQLQNSDLDEIAHSGFDLVVIDYAKDGTEEGKYSADEINLIKSNGIKLIAYLSIAEAENYRYYWQDEWIRHPPPWLGEENSEWPGNYAVKYWHKDWKSLIKDYLDKIIAQGFDGVYLDKVDEFEYWSQKGLLSEQDAAIKMADFIDEIAHYTRSKKKEFLIIPQNGEKILQYERNLAKIVSGWAAEDLFYNGTEPWNKKEQQEIEQKRFVYLDLVQKADKPILSIDYVDDGSGYCGKNKARIEDYRKKAVARGYSPYVAIYDRDLDELNIIEGVQP
ncbi:cysteinyl-tRNA synthetase, unknown class [Nitratiruptor sp. YY09-18]|nr:cysteinyl-tRNA synthetase, unknown class [Nitratiruptor sp. YY09-18]